MCYRPFTTCLILLSLTACNRRPEASDVVESPDEPEIGIIYFSYDNGASWINRSSGLPENVFLTDIALSGQEVALSTKQHGIFRMENDEWKLMEAQPTTKKDIDALISFHNVFFAASQGDGVFLSYDDGASWESSSAGLANTVGRRFEIVDDQLYLATNAGLYQWDEAARRWAVDYQEDGLQVNGISYSASELFIGTNRGVYKSPIQEKNWQLVMGEQSLHNVSVVGEKLYGMAYNELYVSPDFGITWYNDQRGIPTGKYSFQLVESGGRLFVGQWDGIYTRITSGPWKKLEGSLPNGAITEMKVSSGLMVVASSQWIM